MKKLFDFSTRESKVEFAGDLVSKLGLENYKDCQPHLINFDDGFCVSFFGNNPEIYVKVLVSFDPNLRIYIYDNGLIVKH